MAEPSSKITAQVESGKVPEHMSSWHPFDSLQREIERLFDDFGRGFWRSPFRAVPFDVEPLWRRGGSLAAPPVDIVDKGKFYEVSADLPGFDEKSIDISVSNSNLIIKGEKKEEKEENKENYYLQERHFGSFERTFGVPQDVETDKIQAKFEKGVLTVTLPKNPEAQRPAKKIDVKSA